MKRRLQCTEMFLPLGAGQLVDLGGHHVAGTRPGLQPCPSVAVPVEPGVPGIDQKHDAARARSIEIRVGEPRELAGRVAAATHVPVARQVH